MGGDQFAMQDNIKCFVCSAEVNYGDDYQMHLRVVHNIKDSIPFFMERALKDKMDNKLNQKRAAAEVLGVEDIESDPEEKRCKKDQQRNRENDTIVVNKSAKTRILHRVDVAVKKMLSPIVDMCGNLSEGDTATDTGYNEEIKKAFDDLKVAVKEQKIPKKILERISKMSETKEKCFMEQNGKVSEGKQVNDASSKDMTQKPEAQTPRRHKSRPSLAPAGKAPSSAGSVDSSASQPEDRACPMQGCGFRTSRQGLRTILAANHLVKVHNVTIDDIKNSQNKFLFRKVLV
jgi:hypothetical protein